MRTDPFLKHLRALCRALPGTQETTTFGHPTFRAGTKTYAVLDRYHGAPCLAFKLELLEQEVLLRDRRFFAAPYGARHGWTCLSLLGRMRWKEVEYLLLRSYRLVAPRRSVAELDRRQAIHRRRTGRPARDGVVTSAARSPSRQR